MVGARLRAVLHHLADVIDCREKTLLICQKTTAAHSANLSLLISGRALFDQVIARPVSSR